MPPHTRRECDNAIPSLKRFSTSKPRCNNRGGIDAKQLFEEHNSSLDLALGKLDL